MKACAPVPSIDIVKSLDGAPVQQPDGSWLVLYTITVSNDGGADGLYDLTDRLRYGAGITVRSATVTSTPTGVAASSGWTGQGADGAAENVIVAGATLPAGATHTYTVQVRAEVDTDAADDTTFSCPAPGSGEPGGFANTAGVAHNGLGDSADACAAPENPARSAGPADGRRPRHRCGRRRSGDQPAPLAAQHGCDDRVGGGGGPAAAARCRRGRRSTAPVRVSRPAVAAYSPQQRQNGWPAGSA